MAFTEDLSIYFTADTPGAVTVAFAGSPAGMIGIRNMPGVLALDSLAGGGEGQQFRGVQQIDKVVLIRTDQVGSLTPGAAITVAGVATTVRYLLPEPESDGACTVVWYK